MKDIFLFIPNLISYSMTSTVLYRYIGDFLILQDSNRKEFRIKTNIYHPALTCNNSTLYLSGGQTLSILSPCIYSLDLTQDFSSITFPESFSFLANMAFHRFHHTLTFCNNTLYMLGGNDNHSVGNFSERLKLNDPDCQAVPPIPGPCMLHSTTFNNGKIYVVGGLNSQSKYNENIYVFDTLTEKWISKPAKLILTTKPVLIPLCRKSFVVIGGWNKDCKFNNKVVVVDTEKWRERVLKHLVIGEYFHSFIVEGGILSLMDHTGLVHRRSMGLIKERSEFKLWKKEIWMRRKAFLYFLAFNKNAQFNLPLHIAREISEFL